MGYEWSHGWAGLTAKEFLGRVHLQRNLHAESQIIIKIGIQLGEWFTVEHCNSRGGRVHLFYLLIYLFVFCAAYDTIFNYLYSFCLHVLDRTHGSVVNLFNSY